MRFRCRDPEATRRAARALAAAIGDAGLLLGLIGPLGAGKTMFVKGLAEGFGIDPDSVASPTFVIASQYPISCRADSERVRSLAHVDLYRLESAVEVDDAGFVDLLVPGAVVAVEWADRFPSVLPADRLEIRIERDARDEESRIFSAGATGMGSREILAAWRRRLERESAGAEMEILVAPT